MGLGCGGEERRHWLHSLVHREGGGEGSESSGQRLGTHHLHKDVFGVLEAFVETAVGTFDLVGLAVEGHAFDFLLCVHEGDHAAARRNHQFRLVLKHHLNHFVRVAQQNCFPGALPLFDVAQRQFRHLSLGGLFFGEVEFERLEFLVAIQVTFEVLKEHHLLVDGLRVVEEVVLRDLFREGVLRLTQTVHGGGTLARPFDVVEVEQIWMQHNLGRVVKQHAVRAV